jgi:hypothetical protein
MAPASHGGRDEELRRSDEPCHGTTEDTEAREKKEKE